jgi:hypothetical protein
VRLAGRVAQPAVADERGRAAAVEVERLGRAEGDERLGELLQGEAGVVVAAAVGGDGEQAAAARDRECRARVAAGGDVGVELPGAGGEALGVAVRGAREQTHR